MSTATQEPRTRAAGAGPVELTAAEAAELAGLAEDLAAHAPRRVDDPGWQAHARDLSCQLPLRLRVALRRFRNDPGPAGTLVLAGLPLADDRLPATPTAAESVQRAATVPAALAALIGAQLGEIVAYRAEKGGALVQDVLPVPGHEHTQSNAGSQPLALHVENAFHPARPDYVGLLCLRADQGGAADTLVVPIRAVLADLAQDDRLVLGQDRFQTAPPPSFHMGAPLTHPVLGGSPDDPDICLDVHATSALDEQAAEALGRLVSALERAPLRLTLRPGQLALLDNRMVLHGRSRFTPGYDGNDRWLHRIYVQLDHRRSRRYRSGGGAVLD